MESSRVPSGSRIIGAVKLPVAAVSSAVSPLSQESGQAVSSVVGFWVLLPTTSESEHEPQSPPLQAERRVMEAMREGTMKRRVIEAPGVRKTG